MYLDYPYYEHDINVTSTGNDLLIIANKYYKLGSSYVPKDLVKIDAKDSYGNNTFQVVSIVKEKFNKMNADMKKAGLGLLVKSGYRSYQTQVGLYNDYVKANGKAAADTFSARAGYSEHQTGLAIDVCASKSCAYSTFESTDEYKWMKNNSYKYGFILRYPSDKTDITGYKFESWHYRYVGEDVAKYIYDHNLIFDEYYAMFIATKKTN
jgi:D-alanyl-D-alanine carboxypeptidase